MRLDLADLLGDLFEHGLDSLSLLGRDFRPDHFVLVRESLRPRVVNSVLLDGQVYFVARERHYKSILISCRVLLHLADPVLDGLKTGLVGEVVADDGADGIPIVHVDHRSESFVATRVPDVHLYLLVWPRGVLWILYADDFL